MINVGLIGFGYWGPNLARNFSTTDGCQMKSIVDLNQARLKLAKKIYPEVEVSSNSDLIFNDPDIDAIIIALPVSFHYEFAKRGLLKGKHILVEKPLTDSRTKALDLIEIAGNKNRVLMVDHTFLYTGAVQKIKEIVSKNELGNIRYFDSIRINLGLFQTDINVIWDLASHDISILYHLLNEIPYSVITTGISHTKNNIENIAYLTVNFSSNKIAHIISSWTSPVKIRKILIGGTKKMIVYDDVEPTEKVKVYDTGFEIKSKEDKDKLLVDYRVGDIFVPRISQKEALKGVAEDFILAISKGIKPISDWQSGLNVVTLLEAAEESLRNRGKEIIIS